MIEKIQAIEDAIKNKCYLPALALALTIPDICGQVEYINSKSKEMKCVGNRYIGWFDNWVEKDYADENGYTENNKRAKNPYFTGKMCYLLRCAYLHSGNYDIGCFDKKEDEKYVYNYIFKLNLDGCDCWSSIWDAKIYNGYKANKQVIVDINVVSLCNNICRAGRRYYEYKGKALFENKKIEIPQY